MISNIDYQVIKENEVNHVFYMGLICIVETCFKFPFQLKFPIQVEIDKVH